MGLRRACLGIDNYLPAQLLDQSSKHKGRECAQSRFKASVHSIGAWALVECYGLCNNWCSAGWLNPWCSDSKGKRHSHVCRKVCRISWYPLSHKIGVRNARKLRSSLQNIAVNETWCTSAVLHLYRFGCCLTCLSLIPGSSAVKLLQVLDNKVRLMQLLLLMKPNILLSTCWYTLIHSFALSAINRRMLLADGFHGMFWSACVLHVRAHLI